MKKFHESLKFQIYQCCVCHEAWPLKAKPKNVVSYTCSCCLRDKNVPKKSSIENSMIPSPVSKELQGLTQFEEMLVERAYPVMHVYTKPRGPKGIQRACYYLNCHRMYNSLQIYCPGALKICLSLFLRAMGRIIVHQIL